CRRHHSSSKGSCLLCCVVGALDRNVSHPVGRYAVSFLFRLQIAHRPDFEPSKSEHRVDHIRTCRHVLLLPIKQIGIKLLGRSRIAGVELHPAERSGRVLGYFWHCLVPPIMKWPQRHTRNRGRSSLSSCDPAAFLAVPHEYY